MNRRKFDGSFLFAKSTITGFTYLDILTEWLMPQLEKDCPNLIFKQDSPPSNFYSTVRKHFCTNLTGCWIDHARDHTIDKGTYKN
ncbi:hypothetical protein M0804_000218 [Polistes exclamans]|nr:hypothetical protein M0804_000218 [Polistes exclamans]